MASRSGYVAAIALVERGDGISDTSRGANHRAVDPAQGANHRPSSGVSFHELPATGSADDDVDQVLIELLALFSGLNTLRNPRGVSL